jgi:putative heme-binding domain-containing protein
LLESIVEPSRVISDQYQATRFVLRNGREIIGRIVNLGGGRMTVNTNMLDPNEGVGVKPADVEEMTPSKLSPMPTGLLNTLTLDEILDLLAYLRSGGDSEAVYFTASRAGG